MNRRDQNGQGLDLRNAWPVIRPGIQDEIGSAGVWKSKDWVDWINQMTGTFFSEHFFLFPLNTWHLFIGLTSLQEAQLAREEGE